MQWYRGYQRVSSGAKLYVCILVAVLWLQHLIVGMQGGRHVNVGFFGEYIALGGSNDIQTGSFGLTLVYCQCK